MKILITGASGYLGSELVKAFSHKYETISVVRDSSSIARLTGIKTKLAITSNKNSIEDVIELESPNIVINTVTLYGRNKENLSLLVDSNINYPLRLLDSSIENKVDLFLHVGTSLPSDVSAYALSKNTFIQIAKYQPLKKLKFVNIEQEHFYGPGDDSSKFISHITNECLAHRPLNLTSGQQERDFIHIEDTVSAYEAIILNFSKIKSSETIPVGTGETIKVRELVEKIHEYGKSKSTLNFGVVPLRENEVMYTCADVKKLKKLGWKPNNNIDRGIKKLLNDCI